MTKPLCPYFGQCGGCSLQHIPYELQLKNKLELIKNITSIETKTFENIEIYHYEPFFYRNRMDFIFHKKGIGLRQKNKWSNIINIEKCAIANENINKLIKEIRDFFSDILELDYYDLIKKTGTFKQVVIRAPKQDSSVSFVLNEKSTRLNQAIEKIKDFSKITSANKVAVTYVSPNTEVSVSENFFMIKGEPFLTEDLLGKKFHFSIQGFFQNNSIMAEKMLVYVHNLIKSYKNNQFINEKNENNLSNYNNISNLNQNSNELYLLDLYGGVGIFGITNSDLFNHVSIVESFKLSIDLAKKNIELNNLKNINAYVLDAKQIYKLKLNTPLIVITDPPRSGMEQKAIIRLKELKPELIIYVSCNPMQLKKDLTKFKEYEIKNVAMFDLFPQTNHVEVILAMQLKNY